VVDTYIALRGLTNIDRSDTYIALRGLTNIDRSD